MTTNFWKNKNVLITGHTGFKGSWLAIMLSRLGANVFGFSREPEGWDSMYNLLNVNKIINKSTIGDLSNLELMKKSVKDANPDIIFHLAAQAFVLKSYKDPIETWQTNIMGTLNLLESTKGLGKLRAIVNVTTDKCYKNKEMYYSYRENDELGGHDPYSASKAAVEILSDSYRNSFLKQRGVQMATVRGGNVVGGGDFGENRLIPSIIYALKQNQDVVIRHPSSIRPWQHVLDVLNGYMMVAKKLYETDGFDISYNISPDNASVLNVLEVVNIVKKQIPNLKFSIEEKQDAPHEATILKLDNSFTKAKIKWKPMFTSEKAVELAIDWYQRYLNNENLFDVTERHVSMLNQ